MTIYNPQKKRPKGLTLGRIRPILESIEPAIVLADLQEKAMNQITIKLESLKSIRGDVNKKVSTYLKRRGISVVEADVIVLCDAEPGRCWTKKPGQTAVVAHG